MIKPLTPLTLSHLDPFRLDNRCLSTILFRPGLFPLVIPPVPPLTPPLTPPTGMTLSSVSPATPPAMLMMMGVIGGFALFLDPDQGAFCDPVVSAWTFTVVSVDIASVGASGQEVAQLACKLSDRNIKKYIDHRKLLIKLQIF